MANKNVHVVPHGDKWHVIREGANQPSSQHDDQEQAIAAALPRHPRDVKG